MKHFYLNNFSAEVKGQTEEQQTEENELVN